MGNPLFVRNPDPGDGNWATPGDNDYGDLRLQSGSPAIDVGDNNAAGLSGITTDLDGNPRTVNADDKCTPVVDMGAYENQLIIQCFEFTADAPGVRNDESVLPDATIDNPRAYLPLMVN